MKRLLLTAGLLLTLVLTGQAVNPSPASADLSGVMNYSEWNDIDAGMRRAAVNDNCGCSGVWTGNDATVNGWYVREIEYLHSGGFSLVWFRQADDGTWRAYWKRRWIDYDGPDFTTYL